MLWNDSLRGLPRHPYGDSRQNNVGIRRCGPTPPRLTALLRARSSTDLPTEQQSPAVQPGRPWRAKKAVTRSEAGHDALGRLLFALSGLPLAYLCAVWVLLPCLLRVALIASVLSHCPSLCVGGGGGFMCFLRSPIRSLGRLPAGVPLGRLPAEAERGWFP